uniref:Uncharacterized protein n=1 Tax=Callithrix jacchus TaxID=9483 RepID=A0A8I3W9U2_CALJA
AALISPAEVGRCSESLSLGRWKRYGGDGGDVYTMRKRNFVFFFETEVAAYTACTIDPS